MMPLAWLGPLLRYVYFRFCFSRNGPMARHVKIECEKHDSRDSNQILIDDKDQLELIVSCALGQTLLDLHLRLSC